MLDERRLRSNDVRMDLRSSCAWSSVRDRRADADLDDAGFDFLLKIPNKEDNIQTHGEAIREFAYRTRGVRADRALLETRIDSKQKEIMRLKFFEETLNDANVNHP
ncbi:MAG: hypothetical protein HKUEN02_17650 [Anaerolineaceae bacterium]|nr:MAG: hypothetical protein HKUEN02_17650 [Anaerolineaceae bacterium]